MKLTVDIEKRIGDFHLRSSFSTEGGRLALLGASGCGKTMTLKCIAGIERPDRGRITLGNRVLFDSEQRVNLPARKRQVGYLFQNYALFPNMTVRGNITCAAEDRAYAEQLMERFCLTEVAGQYPAELSGGQSQRTALARMLASKPEVILLDEPVSALDNYMRTRMEHEILDILEEFSGPSVLVTHDRNEAYRLADRIGVMDAGTVVEVQDRQDFFDAPQTVAAARLTGCKNISAIRRQADGSYFATDWGISLSLEEKEVSEEITHVGYRAHYFTFEETADFRGEVNVFSCRLRRVIEDTFSVVVCFTQEKNASESTDALLTWIVGKDAWDAVRGQVEAGSFTLRLHPARLMCLKEKNSK